MSMELIIYIYILYALPKALLNLLYSNYSVINNHAYTKIMIVKRIKLKENKT